MKKTALFLMMIICSLALFSGCAAAEELRVDFYDVGKADAALITTPCGMRILIDAGTNKSGKELVERFERDGIDRIDLMIITHYDKDHVGGADKIIEDVGVEHVIMPVYDKESKQYDQFAEAIDKHGVQTTPVPIGSGTKLDISDGVSLSVSAAKKTFYGEDEENDFSLCVRMTYGDTRFLFPGDAEDPRQRELLAEGNVACDVLKVPYHGRLVNASQDFMTAASPKIAFIPDSGEDPSDRILQAMLVALGTQVYSAQQGDLTVVSDGHDVRVP